jgi:hypothetical protein
MPLILPIAGRYSGTYYSEDLGILNDDGFELSMQAKAQEINATDAYGMTLIEAIYRGQDWRIRFRAMEAAKNGVIAALQPFGDAGGAGLNPRLGVIARPFTDMTQSLILSATAGTPAAGNPSTLTADEAIMSPTNNTAMLLTSKVREVPIEMVLLPFTSGSDVIPFTIA